MRVSLAAVPVVVLTLAACGGGSSAGTASTAATSAPAASGQAGGPGPGGPGNNADFRKIQQCLSAAGLSLPTPSGTPSGGVRPTGSPGTRPSGGAGGRGGPGRGVFADKKVQAALKACGITVPTGRRPTTSPTS